MSRSLFVHDYFYYVRAANAFLLFFLSHLWTMIWQSYLAEKRSIRFHKMLGCYHIEIEVLGRKIRRNFVQFLEKWNKYEQQSETSAEKRLGFIPKQRQVCRAGDRSTYSVSIYSIVWFF